MTRPAPRVTIRDVAEAADVSVSTVSRALNGRDRIPEATRQRIRDVAEELGYRPSAVARGLRSQRSQTVAIVSDDIEDTFTAAMMSGVEEILAAKEYSVFLCNTHGEPTRERRHLDRLWDQRVEGVILMSGSQVQGRGAPARPLPGIPVVYLYQYASDSSAPSIIPDDADGAEKAIRHLLDVGYRDLVFINGPARFEATQRRLEGVTRALSATPEARGRVLEAADWYPEHGFELALQLVGRSEQPPEAIFCASDDLAAGALAALREQGLRVPDDVAIVGFDDRPLAKHQHPPLTTIALPLVEMGRRAGRAILNAIDEGPSPAGLELVPCDLIVRASSQSPQPELP